MSEHTKKARLSASLRPSRSAFLDKRFSLEDSSTIPFPEQWLVATSSNPHGGGLFSWVCTLEVGVTWIAKTPYGFQNWMVDSSLLHHLADVLSRTFSQQVMRYRGEAQNEA